MFLVGSKRDIFAPFLDPFLSFGNIAKIDMDSAVVVQTQAPDLRNIPCRLEKFLRLYAVHVYMGGLAVDVEAFAAASKLLILCLAPERSLHLDGLVQFHPKRFQDTDKTQVDLVLSFLGGLACCAIAEEILVIKMFAQIAHVDILSYR